MCRCVSRKFEVFLTPMLLVATKVFVADFIIYTIAVSEAAWSSSEACRGKSIPRTWQTLERNDSCQVRLSNANQTFLKPRDGGSKPGEITPDRVSANHESFALLHLLLTLHGGSTTHLFPSNGGCDFPPSRIKIAKCCTSQCLPWPSWFCSGTLTMDKLPLNSRTATFLRKKAQLCQRQHLVGRRPDFPGLAVLMLVRTVCKTRLPCR